MKRMLLTLFIGSMAALAADVSGNWKATAEGPNGSIERTFVLKVEGAKLTGETVSSFTGKSTINDGKVDGDNLTFTITMNGGKRRRWRPKQGVAGKTCQLIRFEL